MLIALLFVGQLTRAYGITLNEACEGLVTADRRGLEISAPALRALKELGWIDALSEDAWSRRDLDELRPQADRFLELAREDQVLRRRQVRVRSGIAAKVRLSRVGRWLVPEGEASVRQEQRALAARRSAVHQERHRLRWAAERQATVASQPAELTRAHGQLIRLTELGRAMSAQLELFRTSAGRDALDAVLTRISRLEAAREQYTIYESAVSADEASTLLVPATRARLAPERVLDLLQDLRALESIENEHAPKLTALALYYERSPDEIIDRYLELKGVDHVYNFSRSHLPALVEVILRNNESIDRVLRQYEDLAEVSPAVLPTRRQRPDILGLALEFGRDTADVLETYRHLRRTTSRVESGDLPTLVKLSLRYGLPVETLARDYEAFAERLQIQSDVAPVIALQRRTGLPPETVTAVHRFYRNQARVPIRVIPEVMAVALEE